MRDERDTAARAEHMEDGEQILQLRYQNAQADLETLRATDLADVLDGLVALTSSLAKRDDPEEESAAIVRVLPPQEGSFILAAVLTWAIAHPGDAVAVGTPVAGLVAKGMRLLIKNLGTSVRNFERLEGGTVKVFWQNDTVDEVPEEVWNEFNRHKSRRRRDLRKLLTPLADDATSLEIRTGPEELLAATPPLVVATQADYQAVAREVDDTTETSEEFAEEARIVALDFDGYGHWRVRTRTMERSATMEDSDFLHKLDLGQTVSKDDIFYLRMRKDTRVRNGRTSTKLAIVQVISQRRGDQDGRHIEQGSS